MISIKELNFKIGEKKYMVRDKCADNSIYKLISINVDNLGLTDMYPNYSFDISKEGVGYNVSVTEINLDFKLKLYSNMFIKKNHIDKYGFVESEHHPGLFKSCNYEFLKNYFFDILEYFDDDRVYCLCTIEF